MSAYHSVNEWGGVRFICRRDFWDLRRPKYIPGIFKKSVKISGGKQTKDTPFVWRAHRTRVQNTRIYPKKLRELSTLFCFFVNGIQLKPARMQHQSVLIRLTFLGCKLMLLSMPVACPSRSPLCTGSHAQLSRPPCHSSRTKGWWRTGSADYRSAVDLLLAVGLCVAHFCRVIIGIV